MAFWKRKNALTFKKGALLIGLSCLGLLSVSAGILECQDKKAGLESIAPEDAGWSSQKLEKAKAFAEKINSAAVMVLSDGKILISRGNVAKKYKVHSIRKPFLSALIGI